MAQDAITQITQLFLDKELMTRTDLMMMNNVIAAELNRLGVPLVEASRLNTTTIVTAAMNVGMNTLSAAVRNQKHESSILRARKLSSLYSQLVQRGDNIELAKPSTLNVYAIVPIWQIKEKGKRIMTNTWEHDFTNLNRFKLDGLDFMPSINIHKMRVTTIGKRDDVRVYFVNDKGINQSVRCQKIKQDGEHRLMFEVEYTQLLDEEHEYIIHDEEYDRTVVETRFPIHMFWILYRDNAGDTFRNIHPRLMYSRGLGEYLEFQYLSETSLAITHKYSLGGFKPNIGGELRVKCLTTTGRDVIWSDDPTDIKRDPKHFYLNVTYMPSDSLIYESRGGRRSSSDKEVIRDLIIKLSGTRRRIETEPDMNTWLLPYRRNGGASIFRPRLVRNDVKARIFNIYTGLSFNSVLANNETRTFTVPTSSGNLVVNLADLPSKQVEYVDWYSFGADMQIISYQSTLDDNYTLDPTNSITPGTTPNDFTYVSPFIFSYWPGENFCRCFMNAQYDAVYSTMATYEGEEEDITCRFITTNLTVNDYIEEESPNNRIFTITTILRPDEADFEPTPSNFKVFLQIKDVDDNPHRIQSEWSVDEDNIGPFYRVLFKLSSSRRIFNTQTDLTFIDDTGTIVTKEIDVVQNAKLEVYQVVDDVVPPNKINRLVVVYDSEVELFKEITPTLYLQTELEYTNRITFLLVPMVSKEFYSVPHNQYTITTEILKVFDFIVNEVYMDEDLLRVRRFSIRDMLITNYSCSIKFVKTYGASKFLQLKLDQTTPITNLQMTPTFGITLAEEEFDKSIISSLINQSLINHDFESRDLHLDSLVAEVLVGSDGRVMNFQFIRLADNYPPDYHLMTRNSIVEANYDVPEVPSIAPKWNEALRVYEYGITYNEFR